MPVLNKIGYAVDIEQICLEDYWDGERFGDWHSSYSNYFRAIYRKDRPDDYRDGVSSELDLKVGDSVYLVWAEWSDGDSFGHATCHGKDALALFTDYEEAQEFVKWVEDNKEYSYSETYTTKSEEEITIYRAWSGYFETLEGVHIEQTVISAS